MQERAKLNRMIVVKTKRKARGMGKDLIGNERQNQSGKVGIICETDAHGQQGREIARVSGATFRELSRNLHKSGYVPEHVSLKKHGETRF